MQQYTLGATEVCDGIDNDCYGGIDDAAVDSSIFYIDADNDSYGGASVFVQACSVPAGYVTDNTDCDDTNATVNPGATEILNNGIDDDCDPLTDDTLSTDDFSMERLIVEPNPFHQKISVHLPLGFNNETFEIVLFDLNGRVILKQTSSSINGIINITNLDRLSQGAYFIKIINKNEGKIVIRQLIKY